MQTTDKTQAKIQLSNPTFLETPRLILRPFTENDFDAILPIYTNHDVMQFVNHGARTREEVKAELQKYKKHWETHGFGACAVIEKASGKLIGRADLYVSDRSTYPQLGYVLDQPFWGKGYATEAAKTYLNYGFNSLKFHRIVAFARTFNFASLHVLEKLGMQRQRELEYANRQYLEYGISRAEYLAKAS